MEGIEILQKRALRMFGTDAETWSKIEAVLLSCHAGLIPDPKGFFRPSCPYCGTRIKDHLYLHTLNYNNTISYYTCPNCDYEYAHISSS
jgi:hypothetical protein